MGGCVECKASNAGRFEVEFGFRVSGLFIGFRVEFGFGI